MRRSAAERASHVIYLLTAIRAPSVSDIAGRHHLAGPSPPVTDVLRDGLAKCDDTLFGAIVIMTNKRDVPASARRRGHDERRRRVAC